MNLISENTLPLRNRAIAKATNSGQDKTVNNRPKRQEWLRKALPLLILGNYFKSFEIEDRVVERVVNA